MILAFSYRDAAGKYYEPKKVTEREGHHFAGDMPVIQKIDKMSKSRFNVVNPDDIVAAYGANSLRLYEMFIGPLEMTKPWQTSAVHGMRHFLERAWRLVCEDDAVTSPRLVDVTPDPALLRLQHKTVRAVTEGIENLRFNTSIARLMELVNALTPMEQRPRSVVKSLVLLLAPFAPHLCEELWRVLGHGESLAYAPWPSFDPDLASDDQREYVIQLNGRDPTQDRGRRRHGRRCATGDGEGGSTGERAAGRQDDRQANRRSRTVGELRRPRLICRLPRAYHRAPMTSATDSNSLR